MTGPTIIFKSHRISFLSSDATSCRVCFISFKPTYFSYLSIYTLLWYQNKNYIVHRGKSSIIQYWLLIWCWPVIDSSLFSTKNCSTLNGFSHVMMIFISSLCNNDSTRPFFFLFFYSLSHTILLYRNVTSPNCTWSADYLQCAILLVLFLA